MNNKCCHCKNAIEYVGAYTGDFYIECKLEKDFAENATLEQLKAAIENPGLVPCKYCKGKPEKGGVTFDD